MNKSTKAAPQTADAAAVLASTFKDLGASPISSTADDTTANWVTLGTGFAWYATSGQLTDQPSQYGFVLSLVYGGDVFQLWNTQSSGPMYTRSGNASG